MDPWIVRWSCFSLFGNLCEEGFHLEAPAEVLHLTVGRSCLKTMSCFKCARQDVNISRSVEKYLWIAKDPMHSQVNIRLFLKRAIPGGAILLYIIPW